MASDPLSADEQIVLMQIDLQIEALIRDLDEAMGWDADDVDRGLTIQYMRWAFIEGYTAMGHTAADLIREMRANGKIVGA